MWCYKVGVDESGVVVYTEATSQSNPFQYSRINGELDTCHMNMHGKAETASCASICSSSAQHRLTLFCPTSIDSLLPSQSFTETNLSSRPIYSSSARPICFKG
ncbi:hypothetical protein Q3G72_033022 [Acer saccharum]|nr:hypothetical protein Q3G72_033022 [Acer saccharum]